MDTLARLKQMFPGSLVPVEAVIADLEMERAGSSTQSPTCAPVPDIQPIWKERIWTCPAETRLGLNELCEALGKPKSWGYRHTSAKSGLPMIPYRKMDGVLTFVAGEVRAFLREHEEVVHSGPMESTPTEKGGFRAVPGRLAS